MKLVIPSCICGYNVYGEVWIVVLDEQLLRERELDNTVDPDFINLRYMGFINLWWIDTRLLEE